MLINNRCNLRYKPNNGTIEGLVLPLQVDLIEKRGKITTFQRSSKQWITDFEGNYRPVYDNCPAFPGSRVVTNWFTVSDISTWTKQGTTTVNTIGDGSYRINFSGVNNTGAYSINTIAYVDNGCTLAISIELKSENGSGIVGISEPNGGYIASGSYNKTLTLDNTWKRYSDVYTITSGDVSKPLYRCGVWLRYITGGLTSVLARNPQVEIVTAQSNQAPSEYIPTTSAPATKCYDYLNPMTVDGNGVVTDSGVRTPICSEKIENGSNGFSWTGTSLNWWNQTHTNTGTNRVEQVADGVRLLSDGTWVAISKPSLLIGGVSYEYVVDIASVNTGSITFDGLTNVPSMSIATVYKGVLNPTNTTTLAIKRNGLSCDVVIRSISIKPVVKGLLIEPTKSNKCTCYATIPGDTLGSELCSNTSFETDSNADGQADGWSAWSTTPSPVYSRVTGNGFTGYAQRIDASMYPALQLPTTGVTIGKVYTLSFKYRSSHAIQIQDSQSKTYGAGPYSTNTSSAITVSATFCIAANNILQIRAISSSASWIEIDDISFKEVILAVGTTANSLNSTAITNMTLSGYNQTTGNLVNNAKYKITARGASPLDWTGCTLISGTANTVGAIYTVPATGTWTLQSGDAADNQSVSLSIVDDTANLAAAKLLSLNPSGKVYKLDNSLGEQTIFAQFSLSGGSTNPHTISGYYRWTGTGTGTYLDFYSSTGVTPNKPAIYTNIPILLTPASTSDKPELCCRSGGVSYFLMPQLEESPVCTSLTPTAGASATRAAEVMSIPTPPNPVCGTLEWTYGGSTGWNQYLLSSVLDLNNSITIYTTTAIVFCKRIGGTNYYVSKTVDFVAGSTYKIGWRVNADYSLNLFINGTKATTQTDVTAPVWASTTYIGSKDGTSNCPTLGQIKNMKWFSKPLSDSVMISLTT